MNVDLSTVLLIGGLFAFAFTLGQLLNMFSCWVFFHYGSSAGSQAKDAVIAGQLSPAHPLPAPLPAPVPAPTIRPPPVLPAPPPPTTLQTMTMTGPMSVFGGPSDTGMESDEGLALYEESQADQIAGFLLTADQAGAPGLGRRLDPSKFYIACRWDYNRTPKAFLRTVGVHATANGKTINCRPVDWGPNARTGRIADMSPGAAAALGLKTDDIVTVTIPLPSNGQAQPSASTTAGAEPAWLTNARAEIGFHEGPNNTGIQKYVDLAGYGAEGQPWCAIFAGAMLRKADVSVAGCNAMARSFSTSPAFTKLAAYRPGAIAVFWRGSPSGDEGHVGFAVGEDASHVQTLGGNENDQVMVEAIPKSGSTMGLLGYWWPAIATAEPKLV